MRIAAVASLVALVAAAQACGSTSEGTAQTAAGSSSGVTGGGGGGEPAACATDGDCPPASGCTTPVCAEGECRVELAPAGTPIEPDLGFGDCRRLVCGADGSVDSATDDDDLPNDWNPCTEDACRGGSPVHANVIDGTRCGGPGGGNDLECSGGLCAGCNDDDECPEGDVCHVPVCDGETNVCSLAVDEGKVVSNVDPLDCWFAACDAGGAVVAATEEDGKLCGGSTFCDPSRCSAGSCDVEERPPPGTVDPGAPAGDCLYQLCGEDGATLTAPDDSDAPSDPSPNDCTYPACAGGSVTTANHPAGSACVGGATGSCDGAGSCL